LQRCITKHFERPQLFRLNTEMVTKRDIRVFWWWS